MATINKEDTPRWVDEKLSALDPAATATAGDERLGAFREARAAFRARRQQWTWAITGATVATVALFAFADTRAFAARCVEACVGVTTRVGAFFTAPPPLDLTPRGIVSPELRAAAPDFALRDASGRAVRLSALDGHVVLVNFWATWCPPCLTEIPWFSEFQSRYADRRFTVVGVSVDEDGWTAVTPFAARHDVGYPLVLVDPATASAYGGPATLPATFMVDRNGHLASIHTGLVERTVYESEIERLLAE